MKYLKAYEEIENDIIKYIVNKYNFSSKLANYIYHLGYDTEIKVDDYLNPPQSCFHNPFLFPKMQEVVDRINKAIRDNESILIYGDYDVDGIGATYILLSFLKEKGINANYFLPSRHKDGYGLTTGSIDKVIEKFSPTLIITVDCGITGAKEVEYVKSKGVDIIITDHHEPGEIMPDCLVLDCKIPNQEYPFKYLCGAGMALKLVYALSDFETAKKYFTVCAISTIADIVELEDENRYIVKEGLERFNKNCPSGLAYLIKQCKIFGTPNAKEISFKVAPKLNATGRMGDASVALELYLAKDKTKIKELHKKVISMNEERQNLCNIIKDEILVALKDESVKSKPIILLKNRNWDTGILGIVCSKIVENEHKPVILLGYDERTEAFAGSARSYANFDLHSAISGCSDLLLNFGGHKYACGVTIKEENFNEFEKSLCATLENAEISSEEANYYDIELTEKEINFKFAKNLSILEPFGVGNVEPIFKMRTKSVTASPMNNHFEHLLLEIANANALYFSHAKSIYTLTFSASKELYFNLNLDYFVNKPLVKVMLKDFHCEEYLPFNEEICKGAKALCSVLKSSSEKTNYLSLSKFCEEDKDSTIYITFGADFSKQNIDEINYINCVSVGKNTLLVAPISYDNLEIFNKIVFLADLPNTNIISLLNEKYPQAQIFANVSNEPKEISIKMSLITQILSELKNVKEQIFDYIYLFKKYFSKLNISFENLILTLYLLEKADIIKYSNETFELKILKQNINENEIKEFAKQLKIDID